MTHRVFPVDARTTPVRIEVELEIPAAVEFQLCEEVYRESKCVLGNFLYHVFHMLSFFSTPQARVSRLVISNPAKSPAEGEGVLPGNEGARSEVVVNSTAESKPKTPEGRVESPQRRLQGKLTDYIVSQELSQKALRDTVFLFTLPDVGLSFVAQAESLLELGTAASMVVTILRSDARYTVQDAVKGRFAKSVELFLQILDPMLTAKDDKAVLQLLGSDFYKRVTEPMDIIGERYLGRIQEDYSSAESSEAYAELLCAMLLQMCYEISLDVDAVTMEEYDAYLLSTGYAAPISLIQPRKFRDALQALRKAMRKLSDSSYIPYFQQSRVSPLTEISTAQELMRAVLSAFYHEVTCNSSLRIPEVSYHRVHLEMLRYA